MKKIIILSLASIVLFGCVFGAGCISNDNIEFSYSGGEQSISAKAGKIITITTQTNPSTGYSWTEPVVSDGLKIVGSGGYSDAEHGLVGAGGYHYWNVTAEKSGTYTFETEYKRPWEDKVSSTITVTLTFY
ncbi:MAG: protease inhibitor I42 family protein [Methanocorpusculaceae archaeon]|nr:protease inhibitor I42 family protein [Methanocorpusculaceae archaeon]